MTTKTWQISEDNPGVRFDLQGHRGARGLRPENTLPAFRYALELGVTTLEMDVVIAKDETVVVSHEPWMASAICTCPEGKRIPKGREQDHRIYAMTYDEVARYDCGSKRHFRFRRQQKLPAVKPRLAEVIEMAEAFCRTHDRLPIQYNIETKARPEWDRIFTPDPETFTHLLYEQLTTHRVLDRAILQSFDIRTLQIARRLDPRWRCALLVDQIRPGGLAEDIERLGFVPELYSPHYKLLNKTLIQQAHTLGMQVVPWTVNTARTMQRLKDWGVDGLITDYPDVGMKWLSELD